MINTLIRYCSYVQIHSDVIRLLTRFLVCATVIWRLVILFVQPLTLQPFYQEMQSAIQVYFTQQWFIERTKKHTST